MVVTGGVQGLAAAGARIVWKSISPLGRRHPRGLVAAPLLALVRLYD